ncbi:MAG: MFS transporter [Bacteroidales bacterium]|nr:MFS transporter [Bacteroidales bacterium]
MSTKTKQTGTIIVMIALLSMIAFVTHLCSPMSVIVKNQFGASNFLSQIGNYGNFIAYLIMGVPSGLLIKRFGYKKTALIALATGIAGILIQWASGRLGFAVYLVGAFVSGFCMCMLNTVVNPMLNILGGGGNKGNQLIQVGNVFNSAAAIAIYILMGALIADVTKAKISDATPALLIALAIFVIGFIVLLCTKIQEPDGNKGKTSLEVSYDGKKDKQKTSDKYSAFSFRHFKLGLIAIFLYGGIEIGIPTYLLQYLTSSPADITPGLGMSASVAGLIVAVYWLMMLVGRFIGGAIGGKVSVKNMIAFVSLLAVVLVLFGILLPSDIQVGIVGIDWANLSTVSVKVPVGVFILVITGLCSSVMWGGIFNLATEGLGRYTAVASGAFMTMVCGFAVMVALQGWIADITHSYMTSYLVVILCAVYILWYSVTGSRNVNKNIPVE